MELTDRMETEKKPTMEIKDKALNLVDFIEGPKKAKKNNAPLYVFCAAAVVVGVSAAYYLGPKLSEIWNGPAYEPSQVVRPEMEK